MSEHKRLLIKFSGETLRDCPEEVFSPGALLRLTDSITELIRQKVEFGVVLGGGNIFRGSESKALRMDQLVGDQIGMLATLMNGLALKEALAQRGFVSHVMAPRPTVPSVLPHDPFLARAYIQNHEPVFFAGGTGNPFFTTDSAATLRALEIGASLLVKATKVRGIYSKDPVLYPDAERFDRLTFAEVLQARLAVMDQTAVALAMQYGLSIFVFKFGEPPSILEALASERAGTYVVS